MKLTTTTRLYLGFITSFVIAGTIGIMTFVTFNRQVTENKWVDHTYKVLSETEYLQKLLTDLETGRRGFIATNDRKFLEPYNKSLTEVRPVITELRELATKNPLQAAQINTLEKHITELINYWSKLSQNADVYSREDIHRITDQEKDQTDRIRRDITAVADIEKTQLKQRQDNSNASVRIVTLEVVIGTVLVEMIIILLTRVMIREFKTRKRAEEALQNKLNEVEQLNQETSEKNWLLTGLTDVNECLKGVHSVTTLADRNLKAITKYLGLQAGIFYLYSPEEQALKPTATVGIPFKNTKNYKLGEGLPGSAAKDKSLLHITDVPAGYNEMVPANDEHPSELLYVPLYFNHELKGLIELVSYQPMERPAFLFLRSVIDNLSVAINEADAREKVLKLLEQVQKQKEALEHQQEELRQTNEELTRQTESLMASEEEMRVQEQELRQINTELEEKNEAVEMARHALVIKAQELEETSKYKSEFLANMSHELRTPLNSVLILTKLLADNKTNNLTEKQIEYANIIHKSGNDLLHLINDILDLSKIESGKLELNIEPVDIDRVKKDLEESFIAQAEDKGLKFEIAIEPGIAEVIQTDKMRLEQVIKNLVSNAMKFTPKGGTITLSFRQEQNLVPADNADILVIDVKDTGIGVAPNKQKIIFEAFQQADGSTSRKYGGTGLGLSISRELIKRLGGDISLVSEEGKGSTFTLSLPITATEAAPEGQDLFAEKNTSMLRPKNLHEQDTVEDDRKHIKLGDKVMLIIEDDIIFAEIVREYARSRGYKTVVALAGDEGLYYAGKYKPSAITLDMELPILDGKMVLNALKSNEKLKHIPVHVISGGDDGKNEMAGAISILRKPVAKQDLERVFALIGDQLIEKQKKVLVLSGNYLKDKSLAQMTQNRKLNMDCDYVENGENAKRLLEEKKYDCIIADIGQNTEQSKPMLQELQLLAVQKAIPVILYMDKDLKPKDELELRKLSSSIIQDSMTANDRLMDELELFLYKIQENEKKEVPRSTAEIVNDTVLHDKLVLLVDDDMRNVFALTTLLEEQKMIVLTAGDGKEAMDQLKNNNGVDMVLMDVMMPEMDGYEAMKEIRQNPKYRDLPVIALTAKAMPGDQEKCIEAGASDYITKPVDSTRLFSLMRVWLSQ